MGYLCSVSTDTVVNIDEEIHYPIEFLNSLNPSEILNPLNAQHEETLKIATPNNATYFGILEQLKHQ